MVIKILRSSATFSAVDYNDRKVSKGMATLLERTGFDLLDEAGKYGTAATREFLMEYSSKNERAKKAQFHVTLSCKNDEYSYEKLLAIAHQWLDEMGYGKEGQPVLIYEHHDTNNNHLHIVTSRIDPDGKKIKHSFEEKRAVQVMERIMGEDRNQRMDDTLRMAFSYSYENIAQFKAILEASGYECIDKDDVILLRKYDTNIGTAKLADIMAGAKIRQKGYKSKRQKQLKELLLAYR